MHFVRGILHSEFRISNSEFNLIPNSLAFPKIGEGGPLAVDEDDHSEFNLIPHFL